MRFKPQCVIYYHEVLQRLHLIPRRGSNHVSSSALFAAANLTFLNLLQKGPLLSVKAIGNCPPVTYVVKGIFP